MSRSTLPYKAGVVMALAAFVIGITAANAMAWPGGEPVPAPTTRSTERTRTRTRATRTTTRMTRARAPREAEAAAPDSARGPADAARPDRDATHRRRPAPVVSQGAPTPAPEQPIETEAAPPEQGGVPDSPVVAQAPPEQGVRDVPAANRTELAKTGLDPALIALLGAMCLGGGVLLFRRALARN